MPFVNNNQRDGFSSNSLVGKDFENFAFIYFMKKERIVLEKNFEIKLGVGLKKVHRFDFGSKSEKIIVECKSHTWTNGNNIPSAKISVWNEAMFYFNLAPKKYKKCFFVLRSICEKRHKTLLQYYIEKYCHFISKDIIFYEYCLENGHCEIYNFERIENIFKKQK